MTQEHMNQHDEHLADRATGDALSPRDLRDTTELDLAAANLHAALTPAARMGESLRERLAAEGEAIVAARSGRAVVRRSAVAAWLAAAAAVAIAASAGIWAWTVQSSKNRALNEARVELAAMRERAESNEELLASARTRIDALSGENQALARREVDLAQQLASATADFQERLAVATGELDRANLKIARYEQPEDPEVLAANRTKLLEVPDTVRIAWSPFDLPDAPAEQRLVRGDVVWNDELQQGFLRFEGLAVNDPAVEQYQVWVIDERGMEQKVSGGVFNATARGEVIVPIEPGIDVGRVALFAITIEEPGGTWVPDLRRRVVVAPREG